MRLRAGCALVAALIWLLSQSSPLALAGGTRVIRQRLYLTPRCFVAGRRVVAHVRLTHAGPHARVQFIWAPRGVSLGPGYGPGYFRSSASGIIVFSAVSPGRYGQGTVGKWVLSAEWPRAAHPFVRVYFKIVGRASDC